MEQRHYCDAALIGFPDAGKTTLFCAMTGKPYTHRMPNYAPVTTGGDPFVLVDIGGISRGSPIPAYNPGTRWIDFAVSAQVLVFVIGIVSHKELDPNSKRFWYKQLAFLTETIERTGNQTGADFSRKQRVAVLNTFSSTEPAPLAADWPGEPGMPLVTVNAKAGTNGEILSRIIRERLKKR